MLRTETQYASGVHAGNPRSTLCSPRWHMQSAGAQTCHTSCPLYMIKLIVISFDPYVRLLHFCYLLLPLPAELVTFMTCQGAGSVLCHAT